MPPRVSDQQLSNAIYSSIQDGTYPEDEDVVSSEVPSSALRNLSQLLEEARSEVKTSIRELSRLSATDIDGWITQAKQLRADINFSETQAKEIVGLAVVGRELESKARDGASKVHLLRKEVAFNDSLASTLQGVQELKQIVDHTQEATIAGRIREAVSLLRRSKDQLVNLRTYDNTILAGLIQAKISDIEETLLDTVTRHWNSLVFVEPDKSQITIRHDIEGQTIDLASVVTALNALDGQKAKIIEFKKSLESVILTPRLLSQAKGDTCAIEIDGNVIRNSSTRSNLLIENLLAELNSMMEWLVSVFPQPTANEISEVLLPSLMSRLVSGPLSNSVPPDLSGIESFQTTLGSVEVFEKSLTRRNWPGSKELANWTKSAPKVWFARRSNSSLNSIRQLLVRGIGKPRIVERVETQKVAREDDVFQGNPSNDDWDASWSDQDDDKQDVSASIKPEEEKKGAEVGTDEDDVDAWGLGEEEDVDDADAAQKHGTGDADANDEGEDSWGWGNETEETESASNNQHEAPKMVETYQGQKTERPAEREITLRETYHITAIPEQIFEIIIQAIDDGERLGKADLSSNPVAPAAAGLYTLPGVLLSMFRATSPNFYGQDVNGNMFLYNDSLYLAEQLRLFAAHHLQHSRSALSQENFNIEDDVSSLELFGKRAYGKEMELQRTILGDLLDGSQGFTNCTEPPFAQECDIAIISTIDRLRIIHGQWKEVLSSSALLQSIGSLLSTITNKIIVDIEDMSDISEPESQRLASFCKQLTALENLFIPEPASDGGAEGQHSAVAAAVYTPGWWKFQYLSEILESSLADIKYLWTEGELSLEFAVEEVVDLIEALFADSDYRRRAIGEIQRVGRRI